MVGYDEAFSIFKDQQNVKPPSPEDQEFIQSLYNDWDNHQKVTNQQITRVKNILSLPNYCLLRPLTMYTFDIIIPGSQYHIHLNYMVDDKIRVSIPR